MEKVGGGGGRGGERDVWLFITGNHRQKRGRGGTMGCCCLLHGTVDENRAGGGGWGGVLPYVIGQQSGICLM